MIVSSSIVLTAHNKAQIAKMFKRYIQRDVKPIEARLLFVAQTQSVQPRPLPCGRGFKASELE